MPDVPAGGPTSPNARAIAQIVLRQCPCEGCSGTLTDPKRSPGGWGHCRRCRCAWQVVARGTTLFADSIVDVEAGCADGRRRIGLDAQNKEASDV